MGNVLNQSIDTVVAGSVVRAFMRWTLDTTAAEATQARVDWELIDANGKVYNKGLGEAVEVRAHPTRVGKFNFKCFSTIQIPGNIPVNSDGTSYQILWRLFLGTSKMPASAFDTFRVKPPEYNALGSVDAVDLATENTQVQILLPCKAYELRLSVNRGNEIVLTKTIDIEPQQTADGWLYNVDLVPANMQGNQASLIPLTLVWRYRETQESPQMVETSNLYLVNPTIMTAMKDVDSFVNRVYADSGITPGTIFNPVDLVRHLRKGMDSFNSYIRPTNFTMTNATGGVRQYWVTYSIIDACRSMYLYEGVKAFEFAGQAVNLTVDRSQYWDQMANQLQSENDQFVKQLKDNLAKWGLFGGDGNVVGPARGSVGQIGIALSPLTPLRQGYYRPGGNNPIF